MFLFIKWLQIAKASYGMDFIMKKKKKKDEALFN